MKKVELTVDEQWPVFMIEDVDNQEDELIDEDFVFDLPDDLYEYFMGVCEEYRKVQMILLVLHKILNNG